MLPYKAVIVAGSPRTGSMWTFNVTRELLRLAGHSVTPAEVPNNDEGMVDHLRDVLKNPHAEGICTLKVHCRLPQTPETRFIINHRDMHDVLISLMRFKNISFEEGLEAISSIKTTDDYYTNFSTDIGLQLQYAEITNNPMRAAKSIVRFLELDLQGNDVDGVIEKYSKESVKRRIADVEKNIMERDSKGQHISPDELVLRKSGKHRAFDLETGFQSGHVSDYEDGDWKSILTSGQQEQLNDLLSKQSLTTPDPSPSETPTGKIGRNAICPCGSGERYKRCCGKLS